MRLGLLGDIHTEDTRLEAALVFLRGARVDAIVSVGDIVDGPGDAERCITLLRAHAVVTVRGNHDRWLVEGRFANDAERRKMGWTTRDMLSDDALAWLATLPATRTLATPAGSLLLCHGIGADDMVRITPPVSPFDINDVEEVCAGHGLVVAGHTHERFVVRVGDTALVNAGTLSERGAPGFALLDIVERGVRWHDVDGNGCVSDAERLRF